MKQLISIITLLILTTQANAAKMVYWYDIPTNPDNGEFVTQAGILSSYKESETAVNYELNFPTKSKDFLSLGDWMAGIVTIKGQIALPPVSQRYSDNYYGAFSSVQTVIYANGRSEKRTMSCSISNYEFLQFVCFFDGNNSFDFTAADKAK